MDIKSHFEIPVDDPFRAIKFYEDVFGWKIEKWGDQEYWLINSDEKGGMGGGIMKRSGLFEKKGGFDSYVISFEIDNLEEFAEKVKHAGGDWANEGGLIHGVGFHQYFTDTEGNTFGALQPAPDAKDVP